jgi:7-cyano-7-deazaguanine synthase in queuosine biosynthesis
MSATETTTTLFLCDDAPIPDFIDERDGLRIVDLTTMADDGATNLQLDSLVSRLGKKLSPVAEDLVVIASYCVAADQMISRGSKSVDVHRKHWRRRMLLSIPVSAPTFWNRDAVQRALERSLAFATEDSWSFAFSQRPLTGLVQLRINELDDRLIMGQPDCVVLFSGGTDSLCALVEAIGNRNLHPVAVSHRAANQIHRWQLDLLEGVRAALPGWQIPHLSFTMHRRGTGDSDPAQRTRPFLYAALGTAVAATLGVDRVFLPDNGYVSINPKISAELAGALASRGTHPTLLRLMTELNATLFDAPIVIENPLARRTRAEALSFLRDQNCAHLLALTHTCGNHRARTRVQPHCGYCSQCVDRRFAALAAGLAAWDPVDHYGVDIFTAPLPDGEGRKIPFLYRQFARKTEALSDDAMVLDHPELLSCIDPDNPLALPQVLDVLRRHAREVLVVMEEQFVIHRSALARGELPATCLLWVDTDGMGSDLRAVADEAKTATLEVTHRNVIEVTPYLCRFTFQGEKAEVPPLKGARQLVRLLLAPRQEISALDLAYDTAPTSHTAQISMIEEGLRELGGAGDMIDHKARKNYRERAQEIATLLKAGPSAEHRTELRRELEFINDELARASALGGRIRQQSGPHENARTLVHKNVARALGEIEIALPPLREHLRHTLHLGHVCSYAPDPLVHWELAS